MIKYGLKNKKNNKILGFFTSSNSDGEFCCDVMFSLDEFLDGEHLWLVNSFKEAEYVKNNSTEWYNASYETPNHSYKPEQLEIVKFNIQEIE